MARKRLIDTDELFFDSALVDAIQARGLLLYERLWCLAEDWGGYEPKYKDIAFKMGALEFTEKEVQATIEALIDLGKIVVYQADNGRIYHWLKNLHRHQHLNNSPQPRLPLPPWVTYTTKEYTKNGATYKTVTKYEYSLEKVADNTGTIPVPYQNDTGTPERKGIERNRIEREKKTASQATPNLPAKPRSEKQKATDALNEALLTVFEHCTHQPTIAQVAAVRKLLDGDQQWAIEMCEKFVLVTGDVEHMGRGLYAWAQQEKKNGRKPVDDEPDYPPDLRARKEREARARAAAQAQGATNAD